MDTQVDGWKAARYIALGFLGGVIASVASGGLMRLRPNRVTYSVAILGALAAPLILCAVYPLSLLLESRTWQNAGILIAALAVGALSVFSGFFATITIYAVASHHGPFHLR